MSEPGEMMIEDWDCTESEPSQPCAWREATSGSVSATADAAGLRIELEIDNSLDHESGTECFMIPANVLAWLMQAVR